MIFQVTVIAYIRNVTFYHVTDVDLYFSSPAELSKRVSELQTSQAIMLSKQGELNTRYDT